MLIVERFASNAPQYKKPGRVRLAVILTVVLLTVMIGNSTYCGYLGIKSYPKFHMVDVVALSEAVVDEHEAQGFKT